MSGVTTWSQLFSRHYADDSSLSPFVLPSPWVPGRALDWLIGLICGAGDLIMIGDRDFDYTRETNAFAAAAEEIRTWDSEKHYDKE